MSQLIAQLLTAAFVGALSPVPAMATIAVLAGRSRPLAHALGLLAGWTLSLVVIAGLLLWLLHGTGVAVSTTTKAVLNLIIGITLASVGLRNLIGAQHPLADAAAGRPDVAADVPGWMRQLDALTVLKATGVGVVLLAVSPADLATYMSAVQGLAGKGVGEAVVIAIVLIAAIDLCILGPIGIYVAMPGRAADVLGALRRWLIGHQRALMAWVCVGFGLVLEVVAIIHLA